MQGGSASGRARPGRWAAQAFAEGGIESFNVGGVDHPRAALRAAAERFDLRGSTGHNATLHPDHTPSDRVLDHLRNSKGVPDPQAGAAGLASGKRIPKGFADGAGVGAKPVGTDQQRTSGRTTADAAQQAADQSQVPLFTDLPGQPQSVPTLIASAIQLIWPCCLTRISSAWTCPNPVVAQPRILARPGLATLLAQTRPPPSARQSQRRPRWLARDSHAPSA